MNRRVLCVAEKNDAAKNVASFLSNGQYTVRKTKSKYNQLYIFDGQFRGATVTYVFTSVSGHLMKLEFEPVCKDWNSYPITGLFSARTIRSVDPSMKDIEATLREESRRASVLIIWTDCDREGENIGSEIVEICQQQNNRLEILRARFSAFTKSEIMKAMRTLTTLDVRVSNAVDCRQELDLRTGAVFTRFFTLNLKRNNLINFKDVVSYGSCQFPTLGFVVRRYHAIQNFVSEPFWKLLGKDLDSPKIEFLWERGRIADKDAAKAFKDSCEGYSKVISVEQKPKSKWRPEPLNTVELQKLAIRKYRMNAKRVLDTAEKIYSKGYISYPRTETTIFPKDLDFNGILSNLEQNALWSGFIANEIKNKGGPNPRIGKKTDQAHPPIHPVKNATEEELGGRNTDEWKIYEMITRHFLACVSRDAKGHEKKIKVQIGDQNGEVFIAKGLSIVDRGFLAVYPFETWTDKEMPNYNQGQLIKRFAVSMAEGKTDPPRLMTEADLIAIMDKEGIGTDATHADHIKKIKDRGYVVLTTDNRLQPTSRGISFVDSYKRIGVRDNFQYEMDRSKFRADFEKDLQSICLGEKTREAVLSSHLQMYRGIFNLSDRERDKIIDSFRLNLALAPN